LFLLKKWIFSHNYFVMMIVLRRVICFYDVIIAPLNTYIIFERLYKKKIFQKIFRNEILVDMYVGHILLIIVASHMFGLHWQRQNGNKNENPRELQHCEHRAQKCGFNRISEIQDYAFITVYICDWMFTQL